MIFKINNFLRYSLNTIQLKKKKKKTLLNTISCKKKKNFNIINFFSKNFCSIFPMQNVEDQKKAKYTKFFH